MRSNAMTGWHRIKIGLNHTVFGLSGTLFNFAFSIIIVRVYSEQLWGSFARLMLIMTLVSVVTSWGNKEFLLREFSRSNQFAALWQTSLLSRLVLFVLLLPLLFISGFARNEAIVFGLWCLMNFILRSFDSAIVFERKFKEAVTIEVIGFVVIVVMLFILRDGITLLTLQLLFILSASVKMVLYFRMVQKPFLESFHGTFSSQHLWLSVPYFLPPFIGFMNAKADTFAVALKLPEKELGEYYVLISLLSYCHAIATLALVPFLKTFYRINSESQRKIKRLFLLSGMAWSILCLAGIYVTLAFIYGVHFDGFVYLIAALALPPFFIYHMTTQQFFRQDNLRPVVFINLFTAILAFTASLLMIDSFGFVGGLLTFAGTQWLLLTGFLLAQKNNTHVSRSF